MRTLVKTLIGSAITLIMLTAMIWAVGIPFVEKFKQEVVAEATLDWENYRTEQELRKAMRYHGILITKQDKKYEWHFYRDGQKCRLFAYQHKKERR